MLLLWWRAKRLDTRPSEGAASAQAAFTRLRGLRGPATGGTTTFAELVSGLTPRARGQGRTKAALGVIHPVGGRSAGSARAESALGVVRSLTGPVSGGGGGGQAAVARTRVLSAGALLGTGVAWADLVCARGLVARPSGAAIVRATVARTRGLTTRTDGQTWTTTRALALVARLSGASRGLGAVSAPLSPLRGLTGEGAGRGVAHGPLGRNRALASHAHGNGATADAPVVRSIGLGVHGRSGGSGDALVAFVRDLVLEVDVQGVARSWAELELLLRGMTRGAGSADARLHLLLLLSGESRGWAHSQLGRLVAPRGVRLDVDVDSATELVLAIAKG